MSLGLFDVVGPIMHGPSSNHTGGANRIGYVAAKLIGGEAQNYTFCFHPIFMKMFTGHRTHIALLAGCLGMREYEDACNDSKKIADEKGIRVTYRPIEDEKVDRNTMRILAERDGIHWNINGISVGGGNILITRINGIETHLDGNRWCYLFLLRAGSPIERISNHLEEICPSAKRTYGTTAEGELLLLEAKTPFSASTLVSIDNVMGNYVFLRRSVEPMTLFPNCTENPPLFTTFEDFLSLCRTRPMIDVIYEYEITRSGRSREEILSQAMAIVDVIDCSMQRGRKGNNPLLCGYCSGSDGYMVEQWRQSGKSIVGDVFNDAVAGALSMAEVSASAGRVVAVPTSGSAGGLPGALFATAKRFGSSREKLAEAFLVSAAVGVLAGNRCSFSGSIGGCQAEIGIGAGMGAAGAVYLAGGSAEAACHGFCFAIKETLGLVCDPLAGPVEVPCIKRNAMGAVVALMGAEMALAGVRSVVPPDQVLTALRDVQDRMPTELRGACVGGLAASPIAKELQQMWATKLAATGEV